MSTPLRARQGYALHPDAPSLAELNDRLTRLVLDGYNLHDVPLRRYGGRRAGERVEFLGLNIGLGDVFLMAPVLRALAARHGEIAVRLQDSLAARPYVHALLGARRIRFYKEARDLAAACRGPTVALTLKPTPARNAADYVRTFAPELAGAPPELDVNAVLLWTRMLGLAGEPPGRVAVRLSESLRRSAWDELRSLRLRPQDAPLVVLQPASAWRIKEYPARLLREAAERLLAFGARIAVVGRQGEGAPFAGLGLGVADLAGRTSIEGSMALLGYADLLIAPDSVLVHAAAALDVPTLAFFGPTAWRHWASHYPNCFPVELPDEACAAKPCGLAVDVRTMERMTPIGCEREAQCLAAIPAAFVAERAEKILERRRAKWPT